MVSFSDIFDSLANGPRGCVAVAAANDKNVLLAVNKATEMEIAEAVLIGRKQAIVSAGKEAGVDVERFTIIEESNEDDACRLAVRLAREGRADVIMKGLVPTASVLKAVLNKEIGVRDRALLSHVSMFYLDALKRSILLTDAGMCIAPDITTKKQIIANAVTIGRLLGVEIPKVACVCALEKVNEAMPATLDAAQLVTMNQEGEIADCIVGGPFALDNALFEEAAKIKGITDPVAGFADILLMPDIEAGNVLYKAFALLCNGQSAAIIAGAKVPVIITSRSDSDETKLNSIGLALYLSKKKRKQNNSYD